MAVISTIYVACRTTLAGTKRPCYRPPDFTVSSLPIGRMLNNSYKKPERERGVLLLLLLSSSFLVTGFLSSLVLLLLNQW
jgi:hypothetical protein